MKRIDLNILKIEDTCTGCGACVNSCPTNCISMQYNDEGFWYPHIIEPERCISCHKCEKSCHVLNEIEPKSLSEPSWWGKSEAFMYYNDNIRNKSTSGGAFSLIADFVIDNGGVVYATMYNAAEQRLEFSCSDFNELNAFRKSRYFESYTGDIFKNVKKSLTQNRKVMFIGSPCHVRALYRYLGKMSDSELLLTVNFVCHGVPSSEIFHKYVAKRYKISSLINVDSRYQDEKHGWHSLFMKYKYVEGEKIVPFQLDSFGMAFTKSEYLRRCCYTCRYLFCNSADITIGDYWGIKYYKPETDDNKGISLMILHSQKAAIIKNIAQNNGSFKPIPYSSLQYILTEAESKKIENRYNGNKVQYLQHLTNSYRFIIFRNRLKLWIKKILK